MTLAAIHPAIMSWLIEAGAHMNHQDGEGMTALMHVLKNGHRYCAETLLKRPGHDLIIKDNEGKSAKDWARSAGTEFEKLLEHTASK